MINKLISKGNITDFETELFRRLVRGQLIFGNKIQLAEIKILNRINDLKFNEEFFQECEGCKDKISITELTKIDNYLHCENCITNDFYSCEKCGEFIYNDDIIAIDASGYCETCSFEVKQELYHSHKIINPLIKKLAEIITDYNLSEVDFKIEGHLWAVECYSRGYYRLGSWGANCWVDIGSNKVDLLRAIDYNLGDNRVKLTNIFLNDNTELEL